MTSIMPLVLVFAFIFGCVIGSFSNVVSLRFKTGKGLNGRSMCMSCGKTLTWKELVPVFSFAVQKGKCHGCKSKISWQYPLVELTTGLLFVLIASQSLKYATISPAVIMITLLYLISTCILIVITIYDIKHKIIPDSLVYTFDMLALISVFIGGISIIHAPHLWTLLAGPILALPFALLWLGSKGTWMGLGDAKLVLGIGWLLGLNGGANAVILAFWIGAVVSLLWMFATYRRFKSRLEIPFGPYLILGMYLVLLFGIQVLDVGILKALLVSYI